MKSFEYYKASNVAQVISLLGKYQDKAAILAGGSDLLALMKDRIEGPKMKVPKALIDIKGIKEIRFIREQGGGMKIGAGITLDDLISSDVVNRKYPLLVQAARQVAVPQIRNVGTVGGNLCQRPRCWYYRGRQFSECLRKGGGQCYAAGGENQYHSIFGNDTCAMACVSDLAPALAALDARVEIAGAKAKRVVPVQQFFVAPDKDLSRETVLSNQEMVTGVEIPAPSPGARGVYIKIKERQAFDFAMVSVAVHLAISEGKVKDGRVVIGGVAPVPLRSLKAESTLKGKDPGLAMAAACAAAVGGASPLSKNGYKIQVVKGALEQAIGLLA